MAKLELIKMRPRKGLGDLTAVAVGGFDFQVDPKTRTAEVPAHLEAAAAVHGLERVPEGK